jgi:hypothetical protein
MEPTSSHSQQRTDHQDGSVMFGLLPNFPVKLVPVLN